jgi:hypothetical protein
MLVTPTPAGTMCDPELGKRRASFSGAAAARPASDSRASRPDGMARGASNVAREARGRGDGRGGRQDASAYLLRGAGPLSLSVVPFEFFSGWHSAARYWPRGQYPPRGTVRDSTRRGKGTHGVRCYRNCYRTRWDGAGKKRIGNARAFKMCRQIGAFRDARGPTETPVLEFQDRCLKPLGHPSA